MSEWISVNERLPEKTGVYLVRFETGCIVDRNFYDDEPDRFTWKTTSEGSVTHWMPLPSPPKEGCD